MSKPFVEVKGFAELQAKIKELADDKGKKKEILLILRQVARPTLEVAKTLTPISKRSHVARGRLIESGNLKKSLGLITSKSQNPTILVGPRAKGSFNGWYGAIVHEGHNIYQAGYKRKRKSGANNGAAKSRTVGNPYLKNAFSATEGLVTADAEKRMTLFIQRRIDKISS